MISEQLEECTSQINQYELRKNQLDTILRDNQTTSLLQKKKIDLERKVGLSHYSVLQLSKDRDVSTEVLTKICTALNCGIDEIVEFLPNKD